MTIPAHCACPKRGAVSTASVKAHPLCMAGVRVLAGGSRNTSTLPADWGVTLCLTIARPTTRSALDTRRRADQLDPVGRRRTDRHPHRGEMARRTASLPMVSSPDRTHSRVRLHNRAAWVSLAPMGREPAPRLSARTARHLRAGPMDSITPDSHPGSLAGSGVPAAVRRTTCWNRRSGADRAG